MYREMAILLYGRPNHICKCGTDCGGRPIGDKSCFIPGHDRTFAVAFFPPSLCS